VQEHANIAKLTVCELHRVLGHVAQGAALHAVKEGLIEGIALDATSKPEFCDTCTKAKATCIPFPEEMQNRARVYGNLIHTDLWGPAQMESIAGHIYYMSFTDDFSHETKLDFLALKSEALSAFKRYEANLIHQHPGAKIRKLCSDRGGEYLSAEFDAYLASQGIVRGHPSISLLPLSSPTLPLSICTPYTHLCIISKDHTYSRRPPSLTVRRLPRSRLTDSRRLPASPPARTSTASDGLRTHRDRSA
jgi:hypothetical protein